MSLDNLTDCAMDVSDAFSKLREKVLSYEGGNELERTEGLNLINTTNLAFFDKFQISELFRLKGSFLIYLGGRSKANQLYCRAIQICPSYSKAWVSWGGLCASLGYEIEQEGKAKARGDSSQEIIAATAKKAGQYLAQGMGCYLEAIKWDTHELNRLLLPKCLWMLATDMDSEGVLCQTLDTRGVGLPPWVWLPWVSQLLTSLYRAEGKVAKNILGRIVAAHPQSLYFALRSFYLERRDIERASDSNSGSSSKQDHHSPSAAVGYAEVLMSTLRRAHPTLWASLEGILEELIVRFRPSPEEEFLATIAALLQRAETQLENQKYTSSATDEKSKQGDDAALASFEKTLRRVSTKFFRTHENIDIKTEDDRGKKVLDFVRRYKDKFERDFHIDGGDGDGRRQNRDSVDSGDDKEQRDSPEVAAGASATLKDGPVSKATEGTSLNDVHARLKKWKRSLERDISMSPQSFPLQQVSPPLSFFASEAPDLWPGACDANLAKGDSADDGDSNSRSSTNGTSVSAASTAAQMVAAAAAREGVGSHAGGGMAAVEIPGQYAPYQATALDSKPHPELHAKLIRFKSSVEISKRKYQLFRRLGMIGSDGRTHKFLLQFAIPYWTRSDERTAQFQYVSNAFMRKDPIAARKNISLQPTAVIAVAQRLRMTADHTSNRSIDDVYDSFCQDIGRDSQAASDYFHSEVVRLLGTKGESSEETHVPKKTIEKEVKLQVYEKICKDFVEADILLHYTQTSLGTPERSYQFRQSFSRHVAVNSLLQYAFAVVERTPARFIFNMLTGEMVSSDFRCDYNNQGFLEGAMLPYRMTRNIQQLIGPFLLQGLFIPSMGHAASAICEHNEDIPTLLCLLLRDDIVNWYTSKSSPRSDAKTRELEGQLMDRILKNSGLVHNRLKECAPSRAKQDGVDLNDKQPIDKRVRELFLKSTQPERLCMMPHGYEPWL
mmetsp:Transcript_12774/g.26411  ORF Transcript_12774/g.26411 Transcript_12774/m.26411 type:complete len:949 (+) Transcript_12774:36-2882(+)